ncbi:MAG: hypothetical protein AB4058_13560, partial [Microcystaceae cyanobacterium]
MIDYRSQINELVTEASELGDTPTALSLWEAAIKIADTHGDIAKGYQLRNDYTEAAIFSGYPERCLVAFAWCLSQYDQNPDQYHFLDSWELLWRYKWVCDKLTHFTKISKAQIEQSIQDLSQRYQKAGHNQRPIYKLRCLNAIDMGEKEKAIAAYEQWLKTDSDSASDCPACDQDFQVYYADFLKDYKLALKYAQPILKGSLSCTEVPQMTYGMILESCYQLEELTKGKRYQKKGYRLIANNRVYLRTVGQHIIYLHQVEQLHKSIELMEKHLIWALEVKDELEQFHFYLACYTLLSKLVEAGETEINLYFPQAFSEYSTEGKYESKALLSWFKNKTETLALAFDQRNQNNYYIEIVNSCF